MLHYVINKGDTLYKIANKFGVSLYALYTSNPQLEIGEYIYPGQVIMIPQAGMRQYVISRGDSLYLIAEKFSITVQELLQANPQIKDPNWIYVGQVINIPRGKPTEIVQTNQEYDYDDMVSDLQALKRKYPFIEIKMIGKSVMGKSIYAIRLGKGKKSVFYSGDWHANEILTAPLLMKFVENYANAYSQNATLKGYDVNYLFNNTTIWIVPMVNPDGLELVLQGITPDHPYYQSVLEINNGSRNFTGWTANIRGVDLNHQWPADWEKENEKSPQVPSPKKYGGPHPLSEPETIAVYEFTRSQNFHLVIAVHSQGEVIYWGFKDLEPSSAEKIVNRFAVLTGYMPVKTAESAAGYKDWFIQEYRKPGYTVEVGIGTNPLPISQFTKIYHENLALLLEAPLL